MLVDEPQNRDRAAWEAHLAALRRDHARGFDRQEAIEAAERVLRLIDARDR